MLRSKKIERDREREQTFGSRSESEYSALDFQAHAGFNQLGPFTHVT